MPRTSCSAQRATVLVAVLALSALLMACGADRSTEEAQASGRILGLGDSILSFHGSQDDIPIIAANALGYRATNAAYPGARIVHPDAPNVTPRQDIRAQYDTAPPEPIDWVVMNGGINDLAHNCGCSACEPVLDDLISTDGTAGQIPDLVRQIVAQGPNVLYVGYFKVRTDSPFGFGPCNPFVDELDQRLDRMALASDGVWYFDPDQVFDEGTAADPYDADGLHPSVAGSQIIGEHAAAIISEASALSE